MANIQLECDRLVERYARQEQRVRSQVQLANQMMDAFDSRLGGEPGDQAFGWSKIGPSPFKSSPRIREDSSSAYNTGESCRSTPAHHSVVPPKPVSRSPKLGVGSLTNRVPVAIPTTVVEKPLKSRSRSSDKSSGRSPPSLRRSPAIKPPSGSQFTVGDIMYTDLEHLQQTMQLQQRMLRQAMLVQAKQMKHQKLLAVPPSPAPAESLQASGTVTLLRQSDADNVEWKVRDEQYLSSEFYIA